MNQKTPVIIPRIDEAGHMPAWQQELAGAVRSCNELLDLVDIPADSLPARPLTGDFPLRVPHGFIRRMVPGDARDPLLLQVLPLHEEAGPVAGFSTDPLHEREAMPVPGLLHKYHGRALLTVTGACAVHCRYCFRRHFPYSEANPAGSHWPRVKDYLRDNPEIGELILSGGDPLSLTDSRLRQLTELLSDIEHLHTLRIHTRLPVVIPARIDDGFIEWITGLHYRVVMVIHCNHPNEVDNAVAAAMQRLTSAGVTLLNQSVLLKGVNDCPDVLTGLSTRLFACGVLPYYLHQLDRVQGAARFEVDDARARKLLSNLQSRLPGYLVPRLVRELPGETGKTAVT